MHQSITTRKKIWLFILLIILVGGGYLVYTIVFISDIPFTIPNVNNKTVASLEIKKDTLHDYLNNPLTVMELGRLVVKEDRGNQNSNKIEIYFERIKSESETSFPPVFFLAGGPGSSSTRIGRTEYFYLFKELAKYTDVVLIDQRGVGNSIPNLSCRNALSLPVDITENTQEEIFDDIIKKCKECKEEFEDMGIHLKSYNSLESAYDIDDVRKALGYDKITLYGYSYGTELAQLYIKNFETHVERAILVAPLAPDHSLKLPLDVQYQYEQMDSLIKLDKKLVKYIPNFTKLISDVHKKVNKEPIPIQLPVINAFGDDVSKTEEAVAEIISTVKPSFNMILTDDHLQMMISDKIGNDRAIHRLPSFYYHITQGNYIEVGNNLRNFSRRRMPNALFFTVNASTGYSAEKLNTALLQEENSIFTHFGISYSRFPDVYNAFDIQKVPGMGDPVISDTEVLLIGGTLDGRTPSRLTDTIANRFQNHKRIRVENVGHNRLLNNQIMKQIKAFIRGDSLPNDMRIYKDIEFAAPVPYKYSIVDSILKTIDKKGIKEAIKQYQNAYLEFNMVEDYIYNFTFDPIDDISDALVENKTYDNAIEFLEFSKQIHFNNYILYRNLGEAYYKNGDFDRARENLEKALELYFFDPKAQALLKILIRQNTNDL